MGRILVGNSMGDCHDILERGGMEMYCRSCKSFFKEPCYTKDDPSASGVSLTSGYYVYAECPYCGDDDIEESKKCPTCGDDMREFNYVCDSCYKDFLHSMEQVKADMKVDDDTWESLITEYVENI